MVNGEGIMVNGPSQAAIGRALNLSPAAITKLKQQGMPVDSAEAAQRWREQRQNVAHRKPAPASVAPAPPHAPPAPAPAPTHAPPSDYPLAESHDAARTRREIAEANLAEIKLSELRGELIRVGAVKATLAGIFATTREALLQLPSRLAPTLAADTDPTSVHNALHLEIHQALQHLAGAPGAIGQEDQPS